MARLSSAFCFILFLTAFAIAQNTGVPPFNSFSSVGGGIDTINLGNLNVHMEIPLHSLGAYGPTASAGLVLDSLITIQNGVLQPPSGFSSNIESSTSLSVQNTSISGSG
jgi:hypothetical protein